MTTDIVALPFADVASTARRAPTPPTAVTSEGDAARAAREFETFFLAQTFEALQADLSDNGPFGGGQGESVWRSFLSEAYAEAVVARGGIGLSSELASELLTLSTQDG